MKKLFMTLLLFVFILSNGIVTYASMVEPSTIPDTSTVTLTKNYNYPNSPITTFKFAVAPEAVTGLQAGSAITKETIPMITFAAGDSITFGNDATFDGQKELTLNLPTYNEIGIYTYKITEINPTTPWVTYDTNPMFVKVTVTREGTGFKRIVAIRFGAVDATAKGGAFSNTYNAGSLTVSKLVTGNFGDQNKGFDVTITFTSPTGFPVNGTISYVIPGTTDPVGLVWNAEGKATVTLPLKHNNAVTFSNLPYGVTYEVTEASYTADGYVMDPIAFSDSAKLSNSKDADTAVITNNKDILVDTGISLDSIPYILILAVAVIGMVSLVIKKRKKVEF